MKAWASLRNEKSLGRQEQGCVSAEARVQSHRRSLRVCGLSTHRAAALAAWALALLHLGTGEGASKGARLISNLRSLLLKTRQLLIYFS